MKRLLYGFGVAATALLLVTVAILFRSLVTLGRSTGSDAFEPPRVALQTPASPQSSAGNTVSTPSRSEALFVPVVETETQPAAAQAVDAVPKITEPVPAMQSEEVAGKIVFVRGKVTASYPKMGERVLSLQSSVFPGDRIVCDRGAKVQIEFEDGSVIWLGEISQIIIDEYVYNPAQKTAGGCVLKFLKGTCRVITGTMTAVNPDRFKMRTGMTTIGIRGCEVGVQCQETRHSVYAIALGRNETLVVETTKDGSPVMNADTGEALVVDDARKQTATLDRAGTAVTVAAGQGAQVRAFDDKEIKQLTDRTSHLPPARYDLLQEPDGAILILRPQAGSRGGEVAP